MHVSIVVDNLLIMHTLRQKFPNCVPLALRFKHLGMSFTRGSTVILLVAIAICGLSYVAFIFGLFLNHHITGMFGSRKVWQIWQVIRGWSNLNQPNFSL